ncbi:MAG TPA: hypothetical protein VMM84_16230 [Pyrinomonadaceae bacterium]|nr:hypothetical protein [Pyrinomonadaceae bacterium]
MLRTNQTSTAHQVQFRKKERGAALISTLLFSALLLTAGGMLILTTSMTGINTFDSASELQAYYGAEAGVQATLNVLRGNVKPSPLFNSDPNAEENEIDFQKALTKSTSNLASDPNTSGFPARLSRWLSYNYTSPGNTYADRVAISDNYTPFNGIAYNVVLSDPDNSVPPAKPRRMFVQSTGFGPRGARKTLSMMVSSFGLDVEVPGTLVIRGHDDKTTTADVDFGSSNGKMYSGVDNSGAEPQKPVLAISAHDITTMELAMAVSPGTYTDPKYKVLDLPNQPAPAGMGVPPPWFLKTANDARAFLAQAEVLAQKKGVVVSSLSGAAGSTSNPQFTLVKGNCNLSSGAGLLIVTGTLTMDGNPSFRGLILVLGGGTVYKTGGGNGDTLGAIMVAKFGASGNFLRPTFQVSGGGASNTQYDSQIIADSLEQTGPSVLGIAER